MESIDLKNDIMLSVKLSGIQLLTEKITGEKAYIEYYPDHVKISFTPAQKILIKNFLIQQMKNDPGKIRVDVLPIAIPAILSVYGKLIFTGIMAVFFLGRAIGRGSGPRR
jgi:hypothetical protein